MSWRRVVRSLHFTAVLVVVMACSTTTQQACIPDEEGVPVVFVDAAALGFVEPDTAEVCLDRDCRPFGDTSFGGPSENESLTALPVLGDHRERTIVVRAKRGEVLAGPSVVQIPVVAEGCPGEALQGNFVVTADGGIELALLS